MEEEEFICLQQYNTVRMDAPKMLLEKSSNSTIISFWHWVPIFYRTTKLMVAENYRIGKEHFFLMTAMFACFGPLFYNMESPSLFHFALLFIFYVSGIPMAPTICNLVRFQFTIISLTGYPLQNQDLKNIDFVPFIRWVY